MIAHLLTWALGLLAPHLRYDEPESIADIATEAMSDDEQVCYYSERVGREQLSDAVKDGIYREAWDEYHDV